MNTGRDIVKRSGSLWMRIAALVVFFPVALFSLLSALPLTCHALFQKVPSQDLSRQSSVSAGTAFNADRLVPYDEHCVDRADHGPNVSAITNQPPPNPEPPITLGTPRTLDFPLLLRPNARQDPDSLPPSSLYQRSARLLI